MLFKYFLNSSKQTLTKKSNDPKQRQSGHQFVMDDDADNPHIRIRTGGGNQILLNDVENMIYISNKIIYQKKNHRTEFQQHPKP